MAITSANQLELLQTAEAVAREKMIDPGLVIEAMEESLARAAKSRYGADMELSATSATMKDVDDCGFPTNYRVIFHTWGR